MTVAYGGHRSCALGLDLGATSLRIACLGPLGGSFIHSATPHPSAAAEILSRQIHEITGGAAVQCVGLARAPGIDEYGIIHQWPSRPEWAGAPLLNWIKNASGKLAVSADDGICAALWEHERHTAIDRTTITACLSIGTGLGIGIIDGSGHCAGGEGADTLAHQRFGEVTLPCKCGKQGCLQTVLSAEGLEQASRNGMVRVVQHALYDFLRFLRVRYGVSRAVITGGGVLKFERTFLARLFASSSNDAGILFEISASPSMSALGGAFLLALASVGWRNSTWHQRVADVMAGNNVNRSWSDAPPVEPAR